MCFQINIKLILKSAHQVGTSDIFLSRKIQPLVEVAVVVMECCVLRLENSFWSV